MRKLQTGMSAYRKLAERPPLAGRAPGMPAPAATYTASLATQKLLPTGGRPVDGRRIVVLADLGEVVGPQRAARVDVDRAEAVPPLDEQPGRPIICCNRPLAVPREDQPVRERVAEPKHAQRAITSVSRLHRVLPASGVLTPPRARSQAAVPGGSRSVRSPA